MNIKRQEVFKIIAFLGPLALIAGYVRYSVRETMGPLNLTLLIVGGVLTLAAIAVNFRAIRESSRRRSTRLGANTTVMTVAVIAIIGFVNFLGYRHHKRIDLTTEKLYSLSDQTRKVVSDLKKDVKVMLFDKEDPQGLGDQMKEYRNLSSRFTFERIDPQKNMEAAKQYKVEHLGDVIVASGDRNEKPKDTTEQSIINAIIKVTRDSLKKIYFVEGHGEKKLASTNEGDGYGVVDKMLKDENYETKGINLVASGDVPADCDVLVLAGPKQRCFHRKRRRSENISKRAARLCCSSIRTPIQNWRTSCTPGAFNSETTPLLMRVALAASFNSDPARRSLEPTALTRSPKTSKEQ